MKRLRAGSLFSIALATVLFLAVGTQAAEKGANTAHQHSVEIFKWINFAIVAGLFAWVFLKLTPPFFRKRAETISSAITKATAAKAEADRQLKDAESRLARLQQEVADLRASAQREDAAETERIRNATQNDIQKIGLAAKAEIEAAERAARMELKAIAANLAVDEAESLLAKQLTPQTQDMLVANFMQTLEERPN
jgi:F-type H+-transporting ATPase subunit b